jgi:hypothetical protein
VLAPDWAVKIVQEVCALHNRQMPGLKFRQGRKHALSSGSLWLKSYRIVVTFGTSGSDHKQVLLHELAHLLNDKRGHGKEFYLILQDLLIKYDCLTEEYKQRQARYGKNYKYL